MMNGNEERSERGAHGHFAPGWKGGPGRPSKAKEKARLAILAAVVTEDKWREICQVAVSDAISDEDGRTRDRARRFIAEYLIGKPRQTIALTKDDDAGAGDWGDITDDELRAIINAADPNAGPSAANTGGEGDTTRGDG
jgi:hypothetical protein